MRHAAIQDRNVGNDEQLVEVRIDGEPHRGLWTVVDRVITVRVGGASKSARIDGMENYPDTLAKWLVVKLVSS